MVSRRALLAGGALSAAGLGAACTRQGDSLPTTSEPTGAFAEVEGLRIHYRTMGKGPPAVLIHGASGNLRDWTLGPAQALARTNRLIILDRPGQGFSERPSSGGDSLSTQARLLRTAVASLGVSRAHVVGHSYGGAVALAWALDAPASVSGLMTLSAPSQVWEGGVGLIYDIAASPLIGPAFARLAPALSGPNTVRNAIARVFQPQSPPEGYADALGLDLTLRPEALRANAFDLTALKDNIRTMVPRYGGLTMPVEILHGGADEVVPATIHADITHRQIAGARYTRLDGIGHMPHHVAIDAVAAALSRLNARL